MTTTAAAIAACFSFLALDYLGEAVICRVVCIGLWDCNWAAAVSAGVYGELYLLYCLLWISGIPASGCFSLGARFWDCLGFVLFGRTREVVDLDL